MARLLISTTRSGFPDGSQHLVTPITSGCHLARSSGVICVQYVCEKLGGEKSLLGSQIHQICQALAKNPNLQIIVKEGVKPAPKAVESSSTQTTNHQESAVSFQQKNLMCRLNLNHT